MNLSKVNSDKKKPNLESLIPKLNKARFSADSLEEFLRLQAEWIYNETTALRGCRNISQETLNSECEPLVDYG